VPKSSSVEVSKLHRDDMEAHIMRELQGPEQNMDDAMGAPRPPGTVFVTMNQRVRACAALAPPSRPCAAHDAPRPLLAGFL
jgi:hypothetical protein